MIVPNIGQAASVLPLTSPAPTSKVSAADLGGSFGDMLSDAINTLNNQQNEVQKLDAKFVVGDVADVHSVMIAAEKAQLGLSLAVQVRNKAIEAYQEIMRTQI